MVCHIGSQIIMDSKKLVDKIGKPLELDTDGIWCLLPEGFPEFFKLKFSDGTSAKIEFPCSVLNKRTHDKYSNWQYQKLVNKETLEYKQWKEMSIYFELDGPYRAMVIPAAREENKLLKKRYCVFEMDGTIAEIKGFEIRRRGELPLIKIF